MSRKSAIAIIFAVAILPMAKSLFFNEVFFSRDHGSYFQPLRYFTAMQLRRAHLPLWNPYNASGEPWLANPQTGVFYPPAWLFVVLPFAPAYSLFLIFHLALLGYGALLLFSHRASIEAALIGAVALMVCGPTLSLLDVTNNFTTLAWLPLVIWCGVARVRPSICAMTIAMSFLAGEPFFAAAGALIFAIVRRGEPRAIAVAAIGAIAISAIQLIPFVDMLIGSDRAATLPRAQIFRDSMPLNDWLRVIVPPHLDISLFDAHLGQHFVPIVYCGVITIVLALIGSAAGARRRADGGPAGGPPALPWLALLFFAIVVAAGSHLAVIAELFARLPLTLFRYPSRVVPLGAIAIAALAAIGWERVSTRVNIRWLPFALIAIIAADGILHALPLLRSAPYNPHPIPQPSWVGRDAKFVRLPGQSWHDRGAWIDGYLNLYDLRFDAWTAAPLVTQRYNVLYERAMLGKQLEFLNAMSVGYLIGQYTLPPAFTLVARAHGVSVYRNPFARPLAYWRGDDGRIAPATFLSTGTSFARLEVDAPAPGVAVITQQDARGWRAVIDGSRDAATMRVDGVWRGVRVDRGHHVIEWRYDPASFRTGAFITFIAVVWFAFSFWFVKR